MKAVAVIDCTAKRTVKGWERQVSPHFEHRSSKTYLNLTSFWPLYFGDTIHVPSLLDSIFRGLINYIIERLRRQFQD